jgi:hypothetical protein
MKDDRGLRVTDYQFEKAKKTGITRRLCCHRTFFPSIATRHKVGTWNLELNDHASL